MYVCIVLLYILYCCMYCIVQLYLCMYVCIIVYIICIHVLYTCMYILCVCIVCMYVCMLICTIYTFYMNCVINCMYSYICFVCMYVLYVCMHACMYVCMYIYANLCKSLTSRDKIPRIFIYSRNSQIGFHTPFFITEYSISNTSIFFPLQIRSTQILYTFVSIRTVHIESTQVRLVKQRCSSSRRLRFLFHEIKIFSNSKSQFSFN